MRRIVSIAAVSLIFVGANGTANAQGGADDFQAYQFAKKGLKCADEKNYEEAVSYFTKAIKLAPYESSTYMNRGVAYYRLKKCDEALADFNDAIRRGLKSAVYTNMAYAHQQMNALDLVIEDVTAALENGDPEKVVLLRGNAYFRLNQLDAAKRDLDRAVEVDSKNPDCYRIRGAIRNSSRDYRGAIDDFERLVELDPKEVDAYLLKAVAFKELGKDDQALQEIDRALKVDPKTPRALLQRGEILLRRRDWKAARDNLDMALSLAEKKCLPEGSSYVDYGLTKGQAFYYQGMAYRGEKEQERAKLCFDRSIKELTEVIKVSPFGTDAYRWRCHVLRELGRDAEAERDELRIEELSR